MAVWWSKGDFSFLSMRVCVCLKIMTPKGKQDYGIKYHRELENLWNQVERKKKRAENERAGEIRRKEGSGIKWNVKEKKR